MRCQRRFASAWALGCRTCYNVEASGDPAEIFAQVMSRWPQSLPGRGTVEERLLSSRNLIMQSLVLHRVLNMDPMLPGDHIQGLLKRVPAFGGQSRYPRRKVHQPEECTAREAQRAASEVTRREMPKNLAEGSPVFALGFGGLAM